MVIISKASLIAEGGSRSLRTAGDQLNEDIINYARDEFNLLLGEKTAEDIKLAVGSAYPLEEKLETAMRGRDIVTGLPKEIIIDDTQIRKALSRSVKTLVNAIKGTIEETPPELVADIMHRGIFLVGGGSLLRGFDELLAEQTEMPVKLVEDPLTAVVRGAGVVLEDISALKEVLVATQYEEPPR